MGWWEGAYDGLDWIGLGLGLDGGMRWDGIAGSWVCLVGRVADVLMVMMSRLDGIRRRRAGKVEGGRRRLDGWTGLGW